MLKEKSKRKKHQRMLAHQKILIENELEPEDDATPARDEGRRPRRRTEEELTESGSDEMSRAADEAVVLAAARKRATVLVGESTLEIHRPAQLAVVVGDLITIRERSDGTKWIGERLERRTSLSRPDVHNPRLERVFAANIDLVVHVASTRSPPLRTGLIDRFLIAIRHGGAEPLICVNKIDVLDDEERRDVEEELAAYERLAVPIVYCSTMTGEGIERLKSLLRGKVCALVGHSGVGKSSLVNALHPGLAIRVGEVQEKYGRGKHTTSASMMYQLDDETRLIDTPGIRELGLWDIDREHLRWYFPEFEPFAAACRFSDCSHLHEPECAVKAAVEREEIVPDRYAMYERLAE